MNKSEQEIIAELQTALRIAANKTAAAEQKTAEIEQMLQDSEKWAEKDSQILLKHTSDVYVNKNLTTTLKALTKSKKLNTLILSMNDGKKMKIDIYHKHLLKVIHKLLF